ncbi:methyltransferase-like protein 24 [Geospiza fortis]|uniref:Methyltransferase-like protein 24 n=1 Tax=Geospiza fortis TaxID=48883 RepID=A0A6I9ZBJ9_GEOFO|nr:methyltransferase-like protein 24 [Geospiza fortis]
MRDSLLLALLCAVSKRSSGPGLAASTLRALPLPLAGFALAACPSWGVGVSRKARARVGCSTQLSLFRFADGGKAVYRLEDFKNPRTVRWHIELQPWASPTPSLNYEASRFLKYISTSQISCEHMNLNSLKGYSETTKKPWSVCLDERFSLIHRIRSKKCRLYSLGLGNDDNEFELSMANSGCEVHRFDPSIKSAHIQQGRHLWHHRLSIDWRDPNPAIAAHKLHSNTKKLGTVLNEFGHQKIDVLKADVESAEWKILENLILEDVVEQIGQLVFEVHIHWPGFEVSGNDSTVVRYWYSLLRELELKDFRLFHTYKDLSKPQMFLKKEAFNASSCYTLSWVNTRWK